MTAEKCPRTGVPRKFCTCTECAKPASPVTTGMVERAVLNDAEADALRVLANIYIGTPDCHIRREDANALINYMSRLENERSELRSALTASDKDAARYRWLRTRINWKELEIRSGQLSTQYRSWEHQDYRQNRPASEHIDDYIDAAMEKANG